LKGNKTLELWRYVIPTLDAGRYTPYARDGVQAGRSAVASLQFAVVPNPIASGFATLRLVGATSWSRLGNRGLETPPAVRIFDIAGRVAFAKRLVISHSGLVISLDLRKVPAGVYLVWLDAEGYSATQKLVVQR
jgi:hypothetical protein